jgi:hypothetical protein
MMRIFFSFGVDALVVTLTFFVKNYFVLRERRKRSQVIRVKRQRVSLFEVLRKGRRR